jgi:hypothetical protein
VPLYEFILSHPTKPIFRKRNICYIALRGGKSRTRSRIRGAAWSALRNCPKARKAHMKSDGFLTGNS